MVEGFKHQAKEYDCTLRVLETVLVEMWHKHNYMQERLIRGESRSVLRCWGPGPRGRHREQKASDSQERHGKDVSPLPVLAVQVFPRPCHLSQLGAFPKFPGCLGSNAFPPSQVPQNRAHVPLGSDSNILVDPLVLIPSCPSVIRVSHRSQTEFIFINSHS